MMFIPVAESLHLFAAVIFDARVTELVEIGHFALEEGLATSLDSLSEPLKERSKRETIGSGATQTFCFAKVPDLLSYKVLVQSSLLRESCKEIELLRFCFQAWH